MYANKQQLELLINASIAPHRVPIDLCADLIKFTVEEIVEGIKAAEKRYLEHDEDGVTESSAALFLDKLGGTIWNKKKIAEDPELFWFLDRLTKELKPSKKPWKRPKAIKDITELRKTGLTNTALYNLSEGVATWDDMLLKLSQRNK